MYSSYTQFIGALAIQLGLILLAILILWLIIRGAVLSALRKHADEQAEQQRGHLQQ